jgi:hypothetical protein
LSNPSLSRRPNRSDQRRLCADQRYIHFITFSVFKKRKLLDIGRGVRFCQLKSYTYHVDSPRKLKEKLDSMHMNPVREKQIERAVDGRWTSARWYHDRRSVGAKIDWIEVG